MIYRDVDKYEWAKMHELEIKNALCPVCGLNLPVDVPYETKAGYGLMMEKHYECDGTVYIGRFKDLWGEL